MSAIAGIALVACLSFAGVAAAQAPPTRLETAQQVLDLLLERNAVPLSDVAAVAAAVTRWSGEGIQFRSLTPTTAERVGRIPQVQYVGSEPLKNVYAVPFGADSTVTKGFVPNPDTWLTNLSFTATLSEAFLSVQDRATACAAANDAEKNHVIVADNAVRERKCKEDLAYLTGSRRRDYWQRAFSAATVTLLVSQNAKVQQGLVNPDAPVTHSFNATGSFDPTKIWRTSTDWKAAWGALPADILPQDVLRMEQAQVSCGDRSVAKNTSSEGMLRRYAYGCRNLRFAEAMVPSVQVTAVTPATAQANSLNTLIYPPDEHKVLYTVTATWDLRKWLPSMSSRSDAEGAISARETAKRTALANLLAQLNPPPAPSEQDWRRLVAGLFRELSENPARADDNIWWKNFLFALAPIGTAPPPSAPPATPRPASTRPTPFSTPLSLP